nr:hypothetical protein [uncultured Campylobacter sp.]
MQTGWGYRKDKPSEIWMCNDTLALREIGVSKIFVARNLDAKF